MQGKSKQPLLLKVVQTVFPVNAVFGPHLLESLETNSLAPPRIVFQQLVEDLLVKDLPTDLEERNQLCKLQLSPHQQIQLLEDINYLLLFIGRFLNRCLRIDKGYNEIDAS